MYHIYTIDLRVKGLYREYLTGNFIENPIIAHGDIIVIRF